MTATYFDRTLCACGAMHTRRESDGKPVDYCPFEATPTPRVYKTRQCSVEGCEKLTHSSLCPMHYSRWRNRGDVNYVYVKPSRPAYDRVMDKVVVMGDCWEYTGNKQKSGHGLVKVGSRIDGTMRNDRAHRVVYEALVGPIPAGMHLDHLCQNTPCVNPAHLEPVLPAENTRRGTGPSGINARKTRCKRGHPFDAENTVWSKQGRRACRTCQRQWRADYERRQRAHV